MRSFEMLQDALRDRRQEVLTTFVGQLIRLLQKEGCSFDDLLHAIASWAYADPNFDEVVKHLENAATEARRIG
jgi:hypothetical protein